MIIRKHAYKQQYASLYYIRLVKLREAALKAAHQRWGSIPGKETKKTLFHSTFSTYPSFFLLEKPTYTAKILDIKPGELCYMLGTLYLEMPSKPNVMNNLEDEASIYISIHYISRCSHTMYLSELHHSTQHTH